MSEKKKITLALQGGGAHGAITWGVLDRLLEEDDIEIEAVSGASAGAMNAVVLAAGLEEGGHAGARKKLDAFWKAASDSARPINAVAAPWEFMLGGWGEFIKDTVSRYFTPRQLNPLNLNPLLDILHDQVDFDSLANAKTKVFISAANVRNGTTRIFSNAEITPDALMASAALPSLYRPVEIDGEQYWDGGYRSNPPIFPLTDQCESKDLVIVHLNPFERDKVPASAMEIIHRENELNFNASLQHELGFLHHMQQKPGNEYEDLRLHSVNDDGALEQLSAGGKSNLNWRYIKALRDLGREQADRWLKEHKQDLGKYSTFDPTPIISGTLVADATQQTTPALAVASPVPAETIGDTLASGTTLSTLQHGLDQALGMESFALCHGYDGTLRDVSTRRVGAEGIVLVREETANGETRYALPRAPIHVGEQPQEAAQQALENALTRTPSRKDAQRLALVSSGISYDDPAQATSYSGYDYALNSKETGLVKKRAADETSGISWISVNEAARLPKEAFASPHHQAALRDLAASLGKARVHSR